MENQKDQWCPLSKVCSVWQMHNYKLNNILSVLYSDHMEAINHLNSSEESPFLEGDQ